MAVAFAAFGELSISSPREVDAARAAAEKLSMRRLVFGSLLALSLLACGDSDTQGQGGGSGDGGGDTTSATGGAGGAGGAAAACEVDSVVCDGTIFVECPEGVRVETDCAATGQICHAEMRHCM
jgi:hypothetical protein